MFFEKNLKNVLARIILKELFLQSNVKKKIEKKMKKGVDRKNRE